MGKKTSNYDISLYKKITIAKLNPNSSTRFLTIANLNKIISAIDTLNLPIGIYVTNIDGILVKHNRQYESILRADNIIDNETNVLDYYQTPSYRSIRNQRIINKGDINDWDIDVLYLKNNNKEVIVKDISRGSLG